MGSVAVAGTTEESLPGTKVSVSVKLRRPASPDPVERMRFRRAPVAFAAVWFAMGIGLAHLVWRPAAMLVPAFVLLFLLSVLAVVRDLRLAWLPVGAVWLVSGIMAAEWQPAPAGSAALAGYADGLSRSVIGTVVRVRRLPAGTAAALETDSVPEWDQAETGPELSGAPVSLDLALSAVEHVTPDISLMVPVTGGVRVTVYPARDGSAASAFACGDQVMGELRMRRPERFRDPGAWQYGDYLAAQGITTQSSVQAGALRVGGAGSATLRCRLGEAQGWASGRLLHFASSSANRSLPGPLRLSAADAGMIGAMLFGDRTGLNRGLRVGFERTGSFHLFVVSGLHVALLAGAIFWLARRLRAPRWLATLATILVAGVYAAFTGFGQPVQRSLVMVSVYLLAQLLSRERDALNALGAAALAMLLWAPSSEFDAGFQMTVLAVIAIAGIAYPLAGRGLLGWMRAAKDVFRYRRGVPERESAQLRVTLEALGEELAEALGRPDAEWIRRAPARLLRGCGLGLELVLLGLVTEMVMALPMAFYFHRATVFALPANLLVIPVVAVLACSAVAAFVCSLISPWLALLPGAVTAGLLHAVSAAIGRIGRLHGADVRVPGPAWWVAVLAGVALGVCCWAVRRSSRWAWTGTLALPWVAGAALWPEPMVRTPGTLEVTALDVGQGDSLLAVSPEGKTMLIDAGGPIGRGGRAEAIASFDVGEEVVSAYLWSRQVRRLDVVVLTHAHTDHMGGMPAVLRNFRPRELWLGAVEPASPLLRALEREAAELGIPVRRVAAGEEFALGAVQGAVLAPAPGYSNLDRPKNDDSVVLRMQYGRASALLEGDAERPSEDAMLAAGRVGPVTLLKVGHHGSNTSSNPEFLAAAQPEVAVLSAGEDNPFGHPREEVISRFAQDGVRLFRTDMFGLSTFLLNPDGRVREVIGQPLPAHAKGVQHFGLTEPPDTQKPMPPPPAVAPGSISFPAPFSIR